MYHKVSHVSVPLRAHNGVDGGLIAETPERVDFDEDVNERRESDGYREDEFRATRRVRLRV